VVRSTNVQLADVHTWRGKGDHLGLYVAITGAVNLTHHGFLAIVTEGAAQALYEMGIGLLYPGY